MTESEMHGGNPREKNAFGSGARGSLLEAPGRLDELRLGGIELQGCRIFGARSLHIALLLQNLSQPPMRRPQRRLILIWRGRKVLSQRGRTLIEPLTAHGGRPAELIVRDR
jgi:hypothetical protein